MSSISVFEVIFKKTKQTPIFKSNFSIFGTVPHTYFYTQHSKILPDVSMNIHI